MTLCIVWKEDNNVHFASDSRLTFGENQYTDIAIKVLSVPYYIYEIGEKGVEEDLIISGEVGMCFAGSAINSLFIKETIVEMLKNLGYAPRFTEQKFSRIAKLIFNIYEQVSKSVCEQMFEKGASEIIVSGKLSSESSIIRTYKYSPEGSSNEYSHEEILEKDGDFYCIGKGASKANELIQQIKQPTRNDFLNILDTLIKDDDLISVGGNIQYGIFIGDKFCIHNVVEHSNGETSYWRGGIDLLKFYDTEDYSINLPYIFKQQK